MDCKFQVFVSSTYSDLVEERAAVFQALLEMDCLPAGMEMFPAADEDQWTLIEEVIADCDYYVVIVGGRYGSTTADGVSYTEREYDYAVAQRIPILGFVHSNPDQIPRGKSELAPDAIERLDAFRSKVMGRMVKKYASPAGLGSAVLAGLNRAIRHNPRPGWIRGGQDLPPEARAKLAELEATVARLEKELAERGPDAAAVSIDLSFDHGESTVELECSYKGIIDSQARTWSGTRGYSWDDIIATLGPLMLGEAAESKLRQEWDARMLKDCLDEAADDDLPPELAQLVGVEIRAQSWGIIIIQLRALGIIAAGTRDRAVSDRAVYWKLTPAGDAYVVRLRAIPARQ